ncbi:MAG: hypothetical protein JWN82_362 [Candidatus Saccharibacteria bacterium]|nr:hypothetical protein [Candidatus Saccharibacteria bacterium]
MGNVLISLCVAAGAAGLAYSKLGRRVGYGNAASVWTLVAITFGLIFLIMIILLNTLVSLD